DASGRDRRRGVARGHPQVRLDVGGSGPDHPEAGFCLGLLQRPAARASCGRGGAVLRAGPVGDRELMATPRTIVLLGPDQPIAGTAGSHWHAVDGSPAYRRGLLVAHPATGAGALSGHAWA